MDGSSPGPSVYGILQARILEWVAIPFFRRSSQPRDWIWVDSLLSEPLSLKVYPLKCSVQFSHSVVYDSLQPHGLQHTRLPCPSPTPKACSNSCPLSQWHHPTISSSVISFSSCLQSFQMSQFFALGGQSIEVSAPTSFRPMNIQDWFPLGWTGWISLQSKGLSRVFSSTTVQKHKFFGAQLSW